MSQAKKVIEVFILKTYPLTLDGLSLNKNSLGVFTKIASDLLINLKIVDSVLLCLLIQE